jgi:hypothetical protein
MSYTLLHMQPWFAAFIVYYKLGGLSSECWLADSRGISDRTQRVWQNINFYCSNYIGHQFIVAIKAPQQFVVYAQYTTAKGCVQALRDASCLRMPLVPYCLNILFSTILVPTLCKRHSTLLWNLDLVYMYMENNIMENPGGWWLGLMASLQLECNLLVLETLE